MTPRTYCRCWVPACVTLGALIFAVPTLADPPAAPAAQAASAQTIVLQNTVPGNVLRSLHWDQPNTLPPGVTQIVAVPLQNSLLVTATPAGFAQVWRIVRALDVAPRQVQIKFALAHASDTDLKASGIGFELDALAVPSSKPILNIYSTGSTAVGFFQTLTKEAVVTQEPVLTTTSDVSASTSLSYAAIHNMFAVTPHVNNDDSITLALHPVFSDGTATYELNTLRTVKNGDTLVIALPPTVAGSDSFLLFITPAILPSK